MTNFQKLIYKLHRIKTRVFLLFKAQDSLSYAQDMEDLVLDILTDNKKIGFYVDIGANDPNIISVTKKFYERGWTGINVEPSERMYKKLCELRPKDVNLNCAVGPGNVVDFFEPNDELATVGSTCNPALPEKDGWNLNEMTVRKVKTVPLSEIFKKATQPVDFMKIDVEAYEWEVLKSHDWKIKPRVLCIEGKGYDKFLTTFGYKKAFFDGGNSYFKLK